MDFSKEIKILQKSVDFLKLLMAAPLDKLSKKDVKKLMSTLSQCVDDIYYIDDLMPLEEFADKFDKRKDREAFFEVLDLLDEAFGLLDEILGPEEDQLPEFSREEQESPETDGVGNLYAELIKNMKPGRHMS